MLKAFVWCALAATAGAAIVFLPIDPSLIKAVGLQQEPAQPVPQDAQDSGVTLISLPKIVSAGDSSNGHAAIRVVGSAAPLRQQPQSNAVQAQPSGIGRLAVASAPRLVAPPQPAAAGREPMPADTISSLQKELRRVGCYTGRIDGDWGPASRFAMTSFVRSVNATLPTERPDVVLLSLVRGHAGRACGGEGASPAQVETAGALQPLRANLRNVDAWRSKVARAPQPANRADTPHLQKPPRIVSDDGIAGADLVVRKSGAVHAGNIVVRRPPGQATFEEGRMSLGAVPEERREQPPATGLTSFTRLMGNVYQAGAARPSAGIITRSIRTSPSRSRRKSRRRRYGGGSRIPTWARNAFQTRN